MKVCRQQRSPSIEICPARLPKDSAILHSLKSAQAMAGNVLIFMDESIYSRNRRYKVDDFIFDDWNEKSAYLLGVLYTDGWIAKVGSKAKSRIAILLAAKDRKWLEQIRKAFGCDSRIFENSILHPKTGNWSYNVTFGFSSKRIHTKLIEMGIKEQKFPNLPKRFLSHFVRGCFDGDGSFFFSSHAKCIRTSIMGGKSFLTELRDRLHDAIVTSMSMQINPATKNGSCWSLHFGKTDTAILSEYLYRDATLFLKRKKKVALQSIQERK